MHSELAVRPIAWVAFTIAATVCGVIVAVFLLLHFWRSSPDADRVPQRAGYTIEGPVLQSAPQLDLQAYRSDKQRQLDSAGWVDPAAGIVRIPVREAMALLVARAASGATGAASGAMVAASGPAAPASGVAR
jgi:hypothetical protein